MPSLTVSTVGTSLLTNALSRASQNNRIGDVLNHANDDEDRLPSEIQSLAETTIQRTVEELRGQDTDAVREASAELNGLLSLYEDQTYDDRDQHWLVATDTALGKRTAEGVKQVLEDRGFNTVQIQTPRGLSAEDTHTLEEGVKHFLDWCERTLPGFRDSGYEVIFNLTGGFKSLQGILNTVGTFYADRMIYIFQAGPELITIPRLPVKLDSDLFRHKPSRFLRLAALDRVEEATLPADVFSDVPDTLIDVVDGRVYSFSAWGRLLWNQERRSLLKRKEIFDLPRLDATPRFTKDLRKATHDQRRRLYETLAVVSLLLDMSDGDTAPLKKNSSLQYSIYSDRTTDEGEPIGHFQLDEEKEGRRVSCVASHDALKLRRFGRHDEVNKNP
jgi:putative CRISPR-associated protein (TIGR02619 family)